MSENEKHNFLVSIREQKTKQYRFNLIPKYIFTPIGAGVHYFHEELAMKTILIKKTFHLNVHASEYALTFSTLAYDDALKQPTEGGVYDSGINYLSSNLVENTL